MAADTQQYGVDPSQGGQPVPMPGQVDPNSPPPDPMLAGPGVEDAAMEDAAEHQTRERVELQLLLAIESCAKAAMVGEGASNTQFVQAYGQACQAMSLAYASLAGVEQKEEGTGGQQSNDPSQMQMGTGA